MTETVQTVSKKLADYMLTNSIPWPDEGAMRRACADVVRLLVTEAVPEALSLIRQMNPDPMEPDPDLIQSSQSYLDQDLVTDIVTASDGERSIRVRRRGWQREPPEDDGWYVVALDFPHRPQVNGLALHFVRLGPNATGHRVSFSLSDGLADEVEDVSWWLLPALDLPPIPEEN